MSRDASLYLEDAIEALHAIQTYVHGLDYDAFITDQKTTDACVRRFQIIGEAVKNFRIHGKPLNPSSLGRVFQALETCWCMSTFA